MRSRYRLNSKGETEMPYNVFVDDPVTGRNLATYNIDRAYDASAVANLMVDRGFSVSTDLWSHVIANAMVSPDVYDRYGLSWSENPPPAPEPAPVPAPVAPQTAVNAVIVAAMLAEAYDPYWAERLRAYQWCDMTPVVHRVYQGPTDPEYCPDDVWVIEVQYSSKGGRALYGVNRNNVPTCYQN